MSPVNSPPGMGISTAVLAEVLYEGLDTESVSSEELVLSDILAVLGATLVCCS